MGGFLNFTWKNFYLSPTTLKASLMSCELSLKIMFSQPIKHAHFQWVWGWAKRTSKNYVKFIRSYPEKPHKIRTRSIKTKIGEIFGRIPQLHLEKFLFIPNYFESQFDVLWAVTQNHVFTTNTRIFNEFEDGQKQHKKTSSNSSKIIQKRLTKFERVLLKRK